MALPFHLVEGAWPEAVGERPRRTLVEAGFSDVRLRTIGYLARAWGRHLPTFALGLVGDVLAQPFPSRRSTIVIVARA